MDVSFLDDAQQQVVAAIDAGVGRFRDPLDGGWSADLVAAHVILTTELLVRTTEQVLLGAPTWWDNAATSMRANLADVVRAAGGNICSLLDRYWFAAEALTHVAAKLTASQASRPVSVRVVSGPLVVIDQVPMVWGRALRWQADQHLPEHVATLASLSGRR
jgi:hypothetical protein